MDYIFWFFTNIFHIADIVFECEAMISTNNRYGYNNGVVEIETPNYIEVANEYGKFKEFDSFLTVDGFKVFQLAIENSKETDCRLEDRKIGKRKSRKLIWNVEVPKEGLLKYCLKYINI